MIARVSQIESGLSYRDGKRRVRLTFQKADSFHDDIVTTDAEIGIVGLKLDDVVEVSFRAVPVEDVPETLIGAGQVERLS